MPPKSASNLTKEKWLSEHNVEREVFKFIQGDKCYCNAHEIIFIVAKESQLQQHVKMEKHQKNDQLKGRKKAIQTHLDSLVSNKKSKHPCMKGK